MGEVESGADCGKQASQNRVHYFLVHGSVMIVLIITMKYNSNTFMSSSVDTHSICYILSTLLIILLSQHHCFTIAMSTRQRPISVGDSFLYPERQPNPFLRFVQKLDFFSFIPVPKDEPVSTKKSMFGSVIFIILFLIYVGVDLYQFIADNPPIVENAQSMLDGSAYELPRVGITFMYGQLLDQSLDTDGFITYQLTKEKKGTSLKQATVVPLKNNDATYLKDWVGVDNLAFYKKLYSPSEPLTASGLLYSSQTANYSKITISICNLNKNDSGCNTEQEIDSLMAKGRVFLFIEDKEDFAGASQKKYQANKFRIANFFLVPRMYKRVNIQFQVVKTVVSPDYFHQFSKQEYTRLQVFSITEQVSNTSINNYQNKQLPLQMLGVSFLLNPQVLEVRVTYVTLLDHVAKWGAFFNVLFALFAIVFLAHNQKKFYKKNPEWERFRKASNNTIISRRDDDRDEYDPNI